MLRRLIIEEVMERIQKRKKALIAIIVVIIAGCTGGVTVKHALIAAVPEQEVPITAPEVSNPHIITQSTTTIPTEILIPSINVKANIQDIGISIHHTIAVPTNYTDVGWYRYGPLPGNPGYALIDGHRDNGFGLPAVFKRLDELKIGDDIYIVNKANEKLTFEVDNIDTLANASSTESLFSSSDTPGLILITCDGDWQADKEMYSDRLIIYATYKGKDDSS